MDSTGGESPMREQAEEESGKRSEMVGMRSEMQRVTEEPTGPRWKPKGKKSNAEKGMVKSSWQIGEVIYEGITLEQAVELLLTKHSQDKLPVPIALPGSQDQLAKDEEAGKAEASVTEAWRLEESVRETGRPEESGTEVGKAQESLTMGSGKSAMETCEDTSQQLFKDMSCKFSILGHDGDEEKDEIDRGKSALEEQYMPRYRKNPGDRSEDAMMVGSGKSAMHEVVIDPENLQQLLKVMSSTVDILDHGGDDEKDEIDRGKSTVKEEQHMPMLDFEFKSEMEAAESMDTNKGTNTAMVGSDKLLLKPADPSATNSMQYHDLDQDERDRGKSAAPLAKKTVDEEMAEEVEKFAEYSRDWDSGWGETCGFFTYITMLSPMQFTHYTPGLKAQCAAGSTPETLQIFSIELTEITGGLEFPLSVYGVVAARDVVDRNRNILFSRDRSEAQELKQEDRFLRLMGPTRAIVFTDRVDFEIELKVKGAVASQDKALMSRWRRYRGNGDDGVSTISFKNVLCTLELCSQPVQDTIQATVLAIKVVEGPWPFEYGGRVTCSPRTGEFVFTDDKVNRTLEPSSGQIVLLESKGRAMPKGYGVYVHLSRQVVSVQREGALDVVIQAYSKSGARAKKGHVCFVPKFCNISQGECTLGDAKVLITVAWSLVATSKMELRNEIKSRRRVFD